MYDSSLENHGDFENIRKNFAHETWPRVIFKMTKSLVEVQKIVQNQSLPSVKVHNLLTGGRLIRHIRVLLIKPKRKKICCVRRIESPS